MLQRTSLFLLLLIKQGFAAKLDLAAQVLDLSELENAGRVQPAKTSGGAQPCLCGELPYVVDFSEFSRGDYINTVEENALYVSAIGRGDNAYTPNDTGVHNPAGGKARIFDSKLPGPDLDLGSPDEKCPNPGPGRGIAGVPGMPAENCVPLDNLLIVQWKNKINPDDNVDGGSLVFSLDNNVDWRLNEIGVLDTPQGARVNVTAVSRFNGEPFTTYFVGAGANGHQVVGMSEFMPIRYHSDIRIDMPGDGGISHLQFCIPDPAYTTGRRLRGRKN